MAMDRTSASELLQLGTRWTANYEFSARGSLAASCQPMPSSLIGDGSFARISVDGFNMVSGAEAAAISESVDPTWASFSVLRDKGVGRIDLTSEIIEDGNGLLDQNLNVIADGIARFKDAKLRAAWQTGLSGSTVANAAALSLGDVLAEAAIVPSRRQLPNVYGSMSLYHHLKSVELSVGVDTGLMQVAGLPFLVIDNDEAVDASGDLVCFVGHPDLACGYVQLADRVRLLDQALSAPNALTGMHSIVAVSRFAHAVVDPRWLRKIEVA